MDVGAILRRMSQRQFNKTAQSLIDAFGEVCDENVRLREKLSEYDRDEELSNARKEADEIRMRSLLVLSKKEYDSDVAFRLEHYHKCSADTGFLYRLTNPGIGTAIEITCPKCHETIDITDYDTW